MLGMYLGKDSLVIIRKSNDNRQVEWKTLKPGHYTKFSKFHYVSSVLSPTFKKRMELSRTERRKQPTMDSRKLKMLKWIKWVIINK